MHPASTNTPRELLSQLPAAQAESLHGQWWQGLIEASEDAQIVCGSQGFIVETNRRARLILGLDRLRSQETRERSILDAFTAAAARRISTAILRTDGQETISAVTLLSGGRMSMIADVQVTPLAGRHALITIKDASKRWRMESHVQRLITAIDSTPDVVFLTDSTFKITFVNAAFQNVTGHTIEDVLGRTADFLRAPTEVQRIQEYTAAIRDGRDWIGELVNVRSDGSSYPVEAVIAPIHERQGDLLGYAAFERDLTTKRRLQTDLLHQRNVVDSIINSLDSAVYTLDRDFHITHYNDGWRRLPQEHGWLKLDGQPQQGASILSYVPSPARQAELLTLFDLVLNRQKPELVQATSDDRLHHWLIRVAPWRSEGSVVGIILVVTDHTYLHQLQSQLYQAQKMETIGALAAGVAHDFNNLILAIRGNVSLLTAMPRIEPEILKRLGHIDQAANRAADITRQLLSFSRASEERETVLDFNGVVRDASELARRSIKSKVHLIFNLAPEPLKVSIDNTRAQQVLLNLCVNAQDAMPTGGTLTISTCRVLLTETQATKAGLPPETEFLRCSVSDTGTGIPPAVLPRIFDPFFTTKDKDKGTGLGLSIVHNVTSKAGGFLEVESTVGTGTTFHVFLPIAQAGLTRVQVENARVLTNLSGRVLVVDDLDLVRDFTKSALSGAGFEVEVACDAEEALLILSATPKPFDVIFTDYNMPGMSGIQLLHEVAKRWPSIRFILASGYLEEPERLSVQKECGARVLQKPFNTSEAIQLVAEVLRDRPNTQVQPA